MIIDPESLELKFLDTTISLFFAHFFPYSPAPPCLMFMPTYTHNTAYPKSLYAPHFTDDIPHLPRAASPPSFMFPFFFPFSDNFLNLESRLRAFFVFGLQYQLSLIDFRRKVSVIRHPIGGNGR